MTIYALVKPDNSIDRYASDVTTSTGTEAGWRWLPVVDTDPTFDFSTQKRTGPVITVNADNVARVWTVVSKTAQELDDQKTAQVTAAAAQIAGKILFNHENRIRALNSQAPITAQQFITAIKALV